MENTRMTKQTTICCCGSSVWINVIGWIQIVGNFLLMLLLVGTLITLDESTTTLQNYYTETPLTFEQIRNILFVSTLIGLVKAPMTAAFAVLLIIGSYKEKPRLLIIWIIFTITTTFGYVIWATVQGILFEVFDYVNVVVCVLGVLLRAFCIGVVFARREEMVSTGSKVNLAYVVEDKESDYEKQP